MNISLKQIKARCEYAAAKWTNVTQSDLLSRSIGLCLFHSCVFSASLCHLKMIYAQTDVLSLTVSSIVCPFKGYEWNVAPGPIITRVCATYFLAERWKMLRKRSADPLGALAGDMASVQSCRSFFPVPALPVVSTSPRSWLGFVWQPALIAPWGSLGGREPSPWWSEHRTSAKQSIVTGARWGERNKMSQQQVLFFLFLPLMPVGVCLAFDSSVLPSAKRVVCEIC